MAAWIRVNPSKVTFRLCVMGGQKTAVRMRVNLYSIQYIYTELYNVYIVPKIRERS